jgi:hypothetical protein
VERENTGASVDDLMSSPKDEDRSHSDDHPSFREGSELPWGAPAANYILAGAFVQAIRRSTTSSSPAP